MSDYYWKLKVGGKRYNPDQPRVPAGSPEGGRWTSRSGKNINWSRDRDAPGIVPVQMSQAYYRTVKMSPLDFLNLATPMYDKPGTLEYLQDRMMNRETVAPPWLSVRWDDEKNSWIVTQHEGRHRASAAWDVGADVIPVDFVFDGGLRSHNVTDEMMLSPIQKQDHPGDFRDPYREVEPIP